jgi:hypothetical protein
MNCKDYYLRWSVEKISKKGKGLKQLKRNNLHIAMPQASKKIKHQGIPINYAS